MAAAPPTPLPTSTPPLPVGTLFANGTEYAHEDVDLTLTLPPGWTQQ